jgi:hypothetical protein
MYVVRAIKQRCDKTGDDGGAMEKLESDSSEGGGRSCLPCRCCYIAGTGEVHDDLTSERLVLN